MDETFMKELDMSVKQVKKAKVRRENITRIRMKIRGIQIIDQRVDEFTWLGSATSNC